MKFITPLIKITDSCNFNCKFCYYAQKQFNKNMSNRIMPLNLIEKIIKETCELNIKNGNNVCHLIFHGGEPMLAGIEYFERVMQFEQKCKTIYPQIEFKNSIQTNGFAINDKWIDFFKKYNFGVSVSIDGDVDLNFHKLRVTKVDSNKIVMDNLKKLINNNVVLTVMSVITNKHIGNEKKLYDFYVKNKIRNIAFCFCYNKDSDDSINPSKLAVFLKNFFDLYYYGLYRLNVRDFESIFCKLLGKSNGLCLYSNRDDCGSFPTIDSSGNVYFCDVATEKESSIGNLYINTLSEILTSNKFNNEKNKSRKILKDSCSKCNIKDYCGKICYRTDILNEKGCVCNYFCESYKEIILYIKNVLEKEMNTRRNYAKSKKSNCDC